MDANFSKAAMLQFLDSSTKQGAINSNTAGGMRAAAMRILEDFSSEDDVRNIDVQAAAIMYHNKHPGELSTDSLRVYKQRLERLVADFVKYVADPLNFKPRSRGFPKSNGVGRAKQKTESAKASDDTDIAPPAGALDAVLSAPSMANTTMALPLSFPLRENFLAQVVIPRNITSDEARRLCAFITTLPADFKP